MRKIFVGVVSWVMVSLVLIGSTLPLVKAEEVFLDLEGLLPSKEDDPKAYPSLQEPEWYFGNSWTETLSEPGFVEGRAVEYYKRYFAHSDMSVEFCVYLFSNVSGAYAYYNRAIDQIDSEGSYTEVPINWSFAVVQDYGTLQKGVSWTLIINVVAKVAVYTANIVEDPTDQLVTFTLLERSRILDKNPTAGTIPEFPSLILLPLFILTTLVTIRFGRGLRKCARR